MTSRRSAPVLVGLVALVALALLIAGNRTDDRYTFKLKLANALGLRDGSLVTVGGVEVGKVTVGLDRGHGDQVLVTGKLDKGKGPIGRDARASITSVNLLGQKRLELDKGSATSPLPTGSLIPASRVTPSTDLDQVLAVLTPDVRSRLNVLINEAGAGVVGRGTDLSKLIRTLPGTVDKATQLVDGVVTDNHTLGDLVDHSDKLVSDVSRERLALGALIDSAGRAAGSAADKRAQLRSTLARAPGTMAALQRFLGRLEATTVPLGPAARDITAAAPPLLAALAQIRPFQQEAAPTLAKAVEVAPALATLATKATPVLTRATPTVERLAQFASALVPVTNTLDRSVDNLIGTVDNWSRAVQYRDGLSHIFRGEAAVTPQTLQLILNRYLGPPSSTGAPSTPLRKNGTKTPTLPARPSSTPPKPPPSILPPAVQKALSGALGDVGKTVGGILGGVTGRQPPPKQGDAAPSSVNGLLDFLLKP